jgi:hypothetical protein
MQSMVLRGGGDVGRNTQSKLLRTLKQEHGASQKRLTAVLTENDACTALFVFPLKVDGSF